MRNDFGVRDKKQNVDEERFKYINRQPDVYYRWKLYQNFNRCDFVRKQTVNCKHMRKFILKKKVIILLHMRVMMILLGFCELILKSCYPFQYSHYL